MSCPDYQSFGANAESTRLRKITDCVKQTFLVENPVPPTECPLKLPAQTSRTVTTRLESTRLLNKVIACPLYYRVTTPCACSSSPEAVIPSGPGPGPGSGSILLPTSGKCNSSGYTVQSQTFSNIGGIHQITQPVVTVSSGTLIAAKTASVAGNASGSRFIPTFFRGPPLPYICPPAKTSQDPGVPQAPIVRCVPGGRVVA